MTIKDELQRLGYLGRMSAHHAANPLSAHFELHIEQRPRLEDTGKKIGVVQSIQGIRWYEVCIHGERAHAGAAMQDRADALVTASKVVTFLEAEAAEAGALSTVGTLNLDAPSLNTVPGEARFTIDFRCPLESTLDTLETTTTKYLAGLVAENEGLEAEVKRIWRSPAVDMHPVAVSCVRKAAEKVVGNSTMDLCSLAGHDSALIAMRVPTSMIFVPSRDGISHSPLEYTSEEEW
jgi:N-carbamoyl-L-amino-acid hydrolase